MKHYTAPRIWTDSMPQGRVQWRALIITVLNFEIPKKAGNFFIG